MTKIDKAYNFLCLEGETFDEYLLLLTATASSGLVESQESNNLLSTLDSGLFFYAFGFGSSFFFFGGRSTWLALAHADSFAGLWR